MGLYKTIDDTIMKGVNQGVHAWNYTTGRTKADLANVLLDVGTVSNLSGCAIFGTGWALILGASIGGMNIHFTKKNRQVEQLEKKAAESSCADINVEEYKERSCSIIGPFQSVLGLFEVSSGAIFSANYNGKFLVPESCILRGAGWLSFGSSFYVMRADYLPTRKSAVKRAKEKLVEIAADYKRKPAFEPMLNAEGLIEQ